MSPKFLLLFLFLRVHLLREHSGRALAGVHSHCCVWSSRSANTLNKGTQTNYVKLLSAPAEHLAVDGQKKNEHIVDVSHLCAAPFKEPSRLQQMLMFSSGKRLTGIKSNPFTHEWRKEHIFTGFAAERAWNYYSCQ